MSSKELRRVEVFAQVANGSLRLLDAAEILLLSYRQSKRLWKRFRQGGPDRLQHGNAGRPSHRGKPSALGRPPLRRRRCCRFAPGGSAGHSRGRGHSPPPSTIGRGYALAQLYAGAGLGARAGRRSQTAG